MKNIEEIKENLRECDYYFLKNIRQYINKELYFYGSVTRFDYFPGKSDIDIIVDFSQPIGIEFIDLADLLEEKFHEQVDLVSKKGIKPQYFSSIENEIVYV
jgi:predicted nucleotidyltransferase